MNWILAANAALLLVLLMVIDIGVVRTSTL